MATSGNAPSYIDRRKHHKVREVYPDACLRIAPHLYDQYFWVESPNLMLAHTMAHEFYPDLSSSEVNILVGAINHYAMNC
jgi:hypothetical protein